MDNQQLSLEQRKAQRLSLTGVGSKRSRSGSLRFADDDIVCTPRKLGELSAIRLANVSNIIERIISGHNRGEPSLAPQTFSFNNIFPERSTVGGALVSKTKTLGFESLRSDKQENNFEEVYANGRISLYQPQRQ